MIDAACQLVACAACAVIAWRTEPALNRMGRCTHILVRFAMHLLLMSAVAQIGAIVLFGQVPGLPAVIMLLGIALLLLCERRVRVLVPLGRPREARGQ